MRANYRMNFVDTRDSVLQIWKISRSLATFTYFEEIGRKNRLVRWPSRKYQAPTHSSPVVVIEVISSRGVEFIENHVTKILAPHRNHRSLNFSGGRVRSATTNRSIGRFS